MRRITTAVGVVLLLLSAVAPAAGFAGAMGTAGAADAASAQELDCEFPVTATDASGHEVTVDSEPERVVTLNPSAAQTMWEIGAREKVVGVSQFAGFLEGSDSREVVTSGNPSTVNTEQVISLDPDLVLAPNTIDNETATQLRNAGVTVYRFDRAASIEDIYEKTRVVGGLSGACEGADATVSEMRDRVETVEAAVEGQDRPSVYFAMGGGYTAGPDTFVGQVVERAGGDNIAADADTSNPYPQLSAEFVVEQDPEYVVVPVQPERMGNDSESYVPEDSAVRNTTAWEEGNVVVVDTNHISQPAPRVVEPMTQLAQAFHPDAYADANATTTTPGTTDAATTTATTDAGTTAAPTTADAGDSGTTVPGFGVGAAVVAVLGAVLFARR
ncbi:PGF-CTERM-anchored ABC transporter substrate-binding protein [Halobacterium yunchengense]|uniref:PGF-CTERM-anchored ABC transporter substrate-binding protein n=1 Tax=Halobacterium yunchengense TaxID=3108497 RepID=UPI003008480C